MKLEDEQNLSAVEDVSKAMLERVPKYYNYLKKIQKNNNSETISSTIIADDLRLNPILVRKELSYVSKTPGMPRIGFVIDELLHDIEDFLGCNNVNEAVLVGVGRLGTTILSYDGFKEYGLNIVAAFDINENIINQVINEKVVFHIDKLMNLVYRMKIHLGIITVPKQYAQEVCDLMVKSGIRAIWNFAPVHLSVPNNVVVKDENMAISLALLSRQLTKMIK